MRQLLPTPVDVDDLVALLADDPRPVPRDRPWVMANMVSSVDGAYAMEGRSGGLSGPTDREVFHLLRGIADAVLVAAGTARTERYRRPWPIPETQDRRAVRGQDPAVRLVVVSRAAHLPDDQPFLEGEGPTPLLVHPEGADLSDLPAGVATRACGVGGVDLDGMLRGLRGDGAELVLCEGGPRLLGQLHAADLVDELFVTLSPHLVGGGQVGMLGGAGPLDHRLELHRALTDDGSLFLTYRRDRTA